MSDSSPETDADRSQRHAAAGSPEPNRGDDLPGRGRALLRWLPWRPRHERGLQDIGSDLDPRFTFANERTFLAWNRTALALIAAGLAAAQFLKFNLLGLRLIIAVPLIVLGAVLALASYGHWEDSERAMRLRQPLHYSWMPSVLTGGIVVIALVGAILAIIDRLVS